MNDRFAWFLRKSLREDRDIKNNTLFCEHVRAKSAKISRMQKVLQAGHEQSQLS